MYNIYLHHVRHTHHYFFPPNYSMSNDCLKNSQFSGRPHLKLGKGATKSTFL